MQNLIITSRRWQWIVRLMLLPAWLILFVSMARADTIIVTTTDDELIKDGDCSLREAIRAANLDQAVDDCLAGNGADTIGLPQGTYALSIPGTGEDAAMMGDLDLIDDVNIKGEGDTSTIIDGKGLDQVFDIAANIQVAISDVTITGGNGTTSNQGGGLAVDDGGILTMIDSTVSGNEAYNGGGIFINETGMVTLTHSRVNDNDSQTDGGGIYVSQNAALTLTGSQVNGNTANLGGGIFIDDEGVVTFIDSQALGNGATDGGAVYAEFNQSLTLTNSQIISNSASLHGGGIYLNTGTAILTNSQVTRNTAASDGGGVMVDDSQMEITNSQVTSNTAFYGGGIYANIGTLAMVNSTVSGNKSGDEGGGLYVFEHTSVHLYNVTIANNIADSDGDDNGNGGGVYTEGFELGASLITRNSIIGDNIDNSPTGDQHPDCSGELTGAGYNLLENATGCTLLGTGIGSMAGLDPGLHPLQNNGGSTLTHALLSNSPAIDAGNPAGCIGADGLPLTTDQRGFVRPVDGGSGSARCDMGAFEYNASDPSPSNYSIYLPLIQK